MGKEDFKSFLEKHGLNKREEAVDWTQRKEEWVSYINQFYQIIQKWLKPYIDENIVELNFKPITLHEENIGSYETNRILMKIANQEVVFTPIGTLLIGSKGIIDMEGRAGKIVFVLIDKGLWEIRTRPPLIRSIELNEENFFNVLMEMLIA
jgi:hypothetical protein